MIFFLFVVFLTFMVLEIAPAGLFRGGAATLLFAV